MNLCIPTINKPDLLLALLDSLSRGNEQPEGVYVIDNGGHIPDINGVHIHRPARNLGIAGSWNWFLGNVPGHILISNDDIEFVEDTMKQMRVFKEMNPDTLLLMAAPAFDFSGFSFFHLDKRAVQTVGKFDDSFYPAYFEDCDFMRRLRLAGIGEHPNIVCHVGCQLRHVGSAWIKRMSPAHRRAHAVNFGRLRDYYVRKWGGLPGEEKFPVPFDGKKDELVLDFAPPARR